MNTNLPLSTSLTRSLATESLADLLGQVSETTLDYVLEEGTLRDIPVIGIITGMMKAGRDIQASLFLRKIAIFLKEMSQATVEEREKFIAQFDCDEKQYKFGQAILMLLERSDDTIKPRLIAKIITAHIHGHFDLVKTMRLCSIVNRCYTQDLNLLTNFSDGTQGENSAIAESLFAIGLLSQGGIDSGSWDDKDGGIIFVKNEYGQLLTDHVLGNE